MFTGLLLCVIPYVSGLSRSSHGCEADQSKVKFYLKKGDFKNIPAMYEKDNVREILL